MNRLLLIRSRADGTLRVGINYGNPILAQRDAGSGEMRV
jgi:hypothetical protein